MPDAYDPDVKDQFPYTRGWQREMVAKYGDLLNNHGGNNPLELLNDFYDPKQTGLLAQNNIVRFTMAAMVDAQVTLLYTLERNEMIEKRA